MIRILVVDDDRDTIEQLTKLLLEVFDGADVDSGRTVNEGFACLDRARSSGQDYDVAVLDFRLPRDFGGDHKIDESLCEAVSLHMPEALIVHISGYGEDQNVKAHLAGHKPRQGYPVLISKLKSDWAAELTDVIRRFIHSVRIDAKMDRLLRVRRGGAGSVYQNRRANVELPCVTPQLDDLMQDIVDHWDDLDSPLRLRVEQVFELDTSIMPPGIALRGIPRIPNRDQEESRHDA